MSEGISSETRSRMMSGIRRRDTKPELLVRRHLHSAGFRYRLDARDLPGRPDIVLPKWRTAVFVHGCFWHGHAGCGLFRVPKTRTEWWSAKITANVGRDHAAVETLLELGWRVAVVWECALRARLYETLDALVTFIRSDTAACELAAPFPTPAPDGSLMQSAAPEMAVPRSPPADAD